MGSITTEPVVGLYSHPVLNEKSLENIRQSDPWSRNPGQLPPLGDFVQRSRPLIDVRPMLEAQDYSTMSLLKAHGFGVAKHESKFISQYKDQLDDKTIAKYYYPEIEQLILKETGADKVFLMRSFVRQGKPASEEFKIPAGLIPISGTKDSSSHDKKQTKASEPPNTASGTPVYIGGPIRLPHMDLTPLGARQAIRAESEAIYKTAFECGIISREDKICNEHKCSAIDDASVAPIEQHYNEKDRLGPRYASYSIWRPLRKVARDPMSLAMRRDTEPAPGEMVHLNYELKVPVAEFKGDFIKQFALLGVKSEEPSEDEDSKKLKFYYISKQEPDEVLFIQLFDSASLGTNGQWAAAPWHASPEIGNAEGDEPRESIEVRAVVFW